MKPVFSTIALFAALTLTGCGGGTSTPPPSDPSMQTNRLVGTAWELSLIQLPSRERVPVDDPAEYRIANAEENRFVVQVSSNQCIGHYNSTGRALTVRLDCPSASLPPGSVGKEYLAVLNTASHFGMTSSG